MNVVREAIDRYVDALVDCGDIVSPHIEQAFRTVQRHRFVDGWFRLEIVDLQATFHPVEYDRDDPSVAQIDEIYSDSALITAFDGRRPTSSTSQPKIMGQMLERLELEAGMNILEIGAGTGYNAALLAEIVGSEGGVTSIEIQEDVAQQAMAHLHSEGYEQVRVLRGDGARGATDSAPFDRIVATVGCSDIAPAWLDQLAPNGRILVPLQHGHFDPLAEVLPDPNDPGAAVGRIMDRAGFMPIQGEMHWVKPWATVIAGMPQTPRWTRPLPNPLPPVGNGMKHANNHPAHRAFHFFLGLGSRDLWYTNRGCGLADRGAASAIVVTGQSVEGYSATGDEESLETLYGRLIQSLDAWDRLARPKPTDYRLQFVPKSRDALTEGDDPSWTIERPFFWEIVTLPAHDATHP